MKIRYSFLSLMAAVMLPFASQAAEKTFTIKVDDPTHVSITDPNADWMDDNPAKLQFDSNNSVSVTTSRTSMTISGATGWWIQSVNDAAGNDVGWYTTYPTDNASVDIDKIEDGGTINVATTPAVAKTFIVKADPAVVAVTYGGNPCNDPDGDGVWVIEESSLTAKTIRIELTDRDYTIVDVVDEGGEKKLSSYGAVSWDCSRVSTDKTFTVTTRKRTSKMTVNVEGTLENLRLRYRDKTSITLSAGENTVAFDAEADAPFIVEHATYGKTVYKVEIADGGTVERSGNEYSVMPVDGSKLNIEVDYPDKDVSMSFDFVNEGTEGVVKSISVNWTDLIPDANGVYTLKLGSSYTIKFNDTDYNIKSITLNGEPITISSYSASYSGSVLTEEPVKFVVDATAKQPSTITIITEDPESVQVYGGFDYGYVTLTGTTTVTELPASVSKISIKAAAGYKTSYITVGETQYKSGADIPVTDGMTVRCNAEKYVRDKALTLYVDRVDPESYSEYFNMTLHPEYSNDELTFTLYSSSVQAGYSTVMFNSDDVPFRLSGSDTFIAYFNGVKCENEGLYTVTYNINEAADGDVLKIYYGEPATYNVTYTIDSEAAVEVRHDRTQVIDNPSTHAVLASTEVQIVPAKADAELVVKANDADVEKNAEGKYVITVKGDTAVNVAPKKIDSIDSVTADSLNPDAPVYNLQGIQVGTAATADRLPAGVYIVNGRKVKI